MFNLNLEQKVTKINFLANFDILGEILETLIVCEDTITLSGVIEELQTNRKMLKEPAK